MLSARPQDIYATIADYHQGHPSILPPENLYDLQVEQGGYGAGTIIRFKSRIMGIEQTFHHRVSEPEPGRVLVEQDIEPGRDLATTFTVIPLEGGNKAQVEISTRMNASPGLRGLIEGWLIPLSTAPVYRQELKLLEAAAQRRALASAS